MSGAIAELEAMKKVAEAIDELESDSQSRVLKWAADHYGVSVTTAGAKASNLHRENVEIREDDEPVNVSSYETIGDLFARALPGSDAEKALVAGYWIQEEQGNSEFGTQDVNRELKHLGYGVGNITRAFDNLKKTRPQQVIQLRKSGTSKQARRSFKLTEVGKQAVDAMVRNRSE